MKAWIDLRWAAAILVASAIVAVAGPTHFKTYVFHAATPAGYDLLQLKPSGARLSLLGLIECPEIDGVQQIAQGEHARVVTAEGDVLQHFPERFSFRITASLRKLIVDEPSDSVTTHEDPRALLLKLRFRLRAYNGLEVREIQPESVQLIGVPADVQYDERVYRVSFNVGKLPVTERCVLEVLAPDGTRLTRFHFELL